MGDVVQLGRLDLPADLAPGEVEEIRCCGTVGCLRVIIARQADAHPNLVLVVIDGRPAFPAEGVAAAPDTPDGHRLADYVGRAVIRSLLFIADDGASPNNPVAPAES